jgi:hypothetical protein
MFEYLKINRAPLLAIIHEPVLILHRYSVVFAPLKLFSSLINEVRAYTTVRSCNTKHPGLLLSI